MNKRIYLFDNLKALLIVLVVAGHLADTYIKAPYFKSIYVFIYAFHMPLFIFISGYFHRDEDIKRKMLVYISLGYMLKVLDSIVFFALDKKPQFHFLSEDGAPWYLFALAAYIGISYVLRNVDFGLVVATSVILGCFSGYYAFIGDFLCLSRIIVFYPYYLLGMTMAKVDIRKLRNFHFKIQKSILLRYLAIAIIMVWMYWCFGELETTYMYRRLFTGRNPFGEHFHEIGCVHRLICYVLAVVISMAVISFIPDRKIKFISWLGTKTMQIYFWHWPIVYAMKRLLPLEDICRDIYGQMGYILYTIPLILILLIPVFQYPAKWILKYRHDTSYEDEIASLFKD